MNKKFYNFLFWLTYIGFNIETILSIGKDPLLFERFYISGIPSRDIVLILMLGAFAVNQNKIFSTIKRNNIHLFILVICFFTFQGLFINGFSSIPLIRADLRSLLWFLGGISFCFILFKTGNVKLNLQIIVGLTTVLLIFSSFGSQEWQNARVIGITNSTRISHPSIFYFMAFLFTPLILLFSSDNHSLISRILSIFAIGAIVFSGVYFAVCRSILILSLILFVLYFLSLGLKNDGILINKIKIRKGLLLVLLLLSIGSYLLIFILFKESRLRHLSELSFVSITSDSRYSEIIALFKQYSNSIFIVIGNGLGGTLDSPTFQYDSVGGLHIAIFNFWLKMGIIPFISIAIFLFIIIPYQYIKTLCRPAIYPPFKRTANLVILPTLFPWIASLAMSGGFDEVNFLFAGCVYYMYSEVCQNGLENILKSQINLNHFVYEKVSFARGLQR